MVVSRVPEETGCWLGRVGAPGFLWVCEQQKGWGRPSLHSPPMLLIFNKTRVDRTGLPCFLEGSQPSAGLGKANFLGALDSSRRLDQVWG